MRAETTMFVVGCDVSKKKLELALLISLEPLKLRSKVVENHRPGCLALIEWACRQANCGPGELHVVMEARALITKRLRTPSRRLGCESR